MNPLRIALLTPLAASFALTLTGAARAQPQGETPPNEAPASSTTERASPFWLAVQTEGALGLTGDGFYNQLLGARLDYRPDPRFALGFSVSYANLKGPEGRVSNVLPATQLEWRAPLSGKTTLPVRVVTGYLPKNGPWLKAALGLGQPLGDFGVLTLELLAPALWVVHDQIVGSLDVAIEVAFDL